MILILMEMFLHNDFGLHAELARKKHTHIRKSMDITFSKYEGLGNDFIIINNMAGDIDVSKLCIQSLCSRRTGVVSDGVIIITMSATHSLKLVYYSPDGSINGFCGNGSRCVDQYINDHSIMYCHDVTFEAFDGVHRGKLDPSNNLFTISIIDIPRKTIKQVDENTYFLNTGSHHYVTFVEDVQTVDVLSRGKAIRYSPEYCDVGVMVNFVTIYDENSVFVRTYESGIEDETASCGTGSVAAAVALFIKNSNNQEKNPYKYTAHVKYGKMTITFKSNTDSIYDILLEGPARRVFDGKLKCICSK